MGSTNIRRYERAFILLTALIIAFVNTLPFLSSILFAKEGAENPFMNSEFILKRSVWYLLQSFVFMVVLTYFNYAWAKHITPSSFRKAGKVLLLILYNLILGISLIWLTILIAEFTVGNPFGVKGAFFFYFWKYVLIHPLAVLIAYMLKLIMRGKLVEIENYKLKEENLNIQLKTLQDQINPHFLFNTLNTLSSLIRIGSKEDSIQFVSDLASVYRYILESDKRDLVRVKQELEFLHSYNYMLEKRFGGSLSIEVTLEEKVKDTMIPPMVFQLLVENAIKHNVLTERSPLLITISNDTSHIHVRNNILARPTETENHGIGLSNLTQRYQLLTGKEIIIRSEESQFMVSLPLIRP